MHHLDSLPSLRAVFCAVYTRCSRPREAAAYFYRFLSPFARPIQSVRP